MDRSDGLLILDDTTSRASALEKPYANEIDHVTWHWSGKHNDTVKGINLLTLLWGGPSEEEEDTSSGKEAPNEAHIPCDFRLYNKDEDGLTKNDHFRQMLEVASRRGFEPAYVVFYSWHSGLDSLKKIRSQQWLFFTRLKSNRQVNPDDTGNCAVREVDIPEEGRRVHLKGFGFVKVFRTGSKSGDAEDGDAKYWATNDLGMTEEKREELARRAWGGGNVPSPTQAVLRSGTLAAPEHAGTAQPCAHVDPCVFATGSASARNGGQFLYVKSGDHPGSHTSLSGRSDPHSRFKCVSPNGVNW